MSVLLSEESILLQFPLCYLLYGFGTCLEPKEKSLADKKIVPEVMFKLVKKLT